MAYNKSDILKVIQILHREFKLPYQERLDFNTFQKFLEKNGGVVKEKEFSQTFLEDGYIQLNEDNTFLICLNSERYGSDGRKYFNLVKFFGHLLFHTSYLEEKNKKEIFKNEVFHNRYYDTYESEAVEFAKSLLMPYEDMKEEMYENSKNGHIDMNKIAEIFKVDEQMATIRAGNLGFIS
jgi:Zn-dependent peptidase ImmA (M78 family)